MITPNTKNKKEEKKIPNLRFPGFEGEWENYALGSIAHFSKGKGISKSDIAQNGELECIRYGELYTIYDEVIINIKSRTNLKSAALVLSEKNDVIIPASGETQIDIATASCVLKTGVALGGDLNIIKAPVDGVFLSYYLNNKKKIDIAKLSQGISVVHLYSSQLKTLNLNLPETSEQQKIASFLSAMDQKIQQLTRKKKLLEQYKKGVMQKIFSREIRFRDENGNDYPDWEEKRLGEFASVTMGQSPDSKSYNHNGNGLLLIQGNADIVNRLTNPRQWTNEPTKTCEVGDLILTVRAPVGSISKSIHNACMGRGVCSIKSKNNSDIEFLYQILLDYELKWVQLEQGSTFTAVSRNDIKSIKIYLPILPEQQKIASLLKSIDNKIESIQTQINQTQQFKKGLLQQMFV